MKQLLRTFKKWGVGAVVLGVLYATLLPWVLSRIQRAEEKRDDRQMMTAALDAGMVGTWYWHIESGMLHWSDSMFAVYGVDRPEYPLTYSFWVERLVPDDRERTEQLLQKVVRENLHFDASWRVVDKFNRVRTIGARGQVTPDGTAMAGVNFIARFSGPDEFADNVEQAFQRQLDRAQAQLKQMRGAK